MKTSFPENLRLIGIILSFGCSFHGIAQSPPLTATDIKNGVFVYFSYRDGSKSTYTRNGDTQKEVNSVTRENTLWDIQWINDSTYSMQYNSGLEDHPKEELNLLKKHKVVVQILAVTDNYYIFRSSPDKASNPAILTDTLWIKQRRDPKNKVVGNPNIDSILVTRRAAFDSAISKTATLYVFRPGKFAEGGQDCILTINDTPVVVINNKATFIIRFVKEGQTKISEKVNKQESVVMLDVKKGNKYFLRCEVLWRIPPKPILTLVSAEEGRTYFDNIK